MNVARFNCSHGDWETKKRWAEWIRELSPAIGPVAILVDLQGPKFRIGQVAGGMIDLQAGQTVIVGPVENAQIPIDQPEILSTLSANTKLLLGDGNVELRISGQHGEGWQAKVICGGIVRARQGVTVVGKVFDVPCMTDQDMGDIKQAAAIQADFVALSYVRDGQDMVKLRESLAKLDPAIALCAKIETKEAVRNLDDILKASDLIMVARGDMGLQMDIEDVPLTQKKIIQACLEQGKPVITATQMLESMCSSPRPTRAETTDVANAILDGTDALMLSGETANGEYPLECVRMMVKIAEKAEPAYDRKPLEQRFKDLKKRKEVNQTLAVAHAAIDLVDLTGAQAVVTASTSGLSPRLISRFRPNVPIYCATLNQRVQRQLAVTRGVHAAHLNMPKTTDHNIQGSIDAFAQGKRLKSGDLVIVTSGWPAGVPGNTNLITAQVIP